MVKIKLIRPIIRIEEFDALENATIFATGVTTDTSDGLHMMGTGKEIIWIAKKGDGGHDWAVYTHYSNRDLYFIQTQGDKVYNRDSIANILDIDDDMWERYRH